jgi:DNA repair photolyase
LEEFARHSEFHVGIVTKSDLILRDTELLQEIASKNRLFVNITITTLNTNLARILEPRAPRPDLRLDAVCKLNEAGVQAGVICAPVMPGITDAPRDLEALVKATAAVGGKYIFANPLFLKPCSAAVFMPFLEKEFPDLVQSYHERYKDKAFLPEAYATRLSQLMQRLRAKHGIQNSYERYKQKSRESQENAQLSLF